MSETDEQSVSRRSFLETAGAGLAGLSALNYSSLAKGMGPSGVSAQDTITMGFIGVGGMGKNRLRGFMEHDDVDVAAICDVDTRHIDEAVGMVQEERDRQPDTYGDFRNLLEDDSIDAVTVVTPDHWHAIPTVRASEAGKDVFVEKPLSYSVAEGRAMVTAANENKTVTQMGNHIHNDVNNYRRVVERVQSGQLGRITRIHLWKTVGTEGRGNPPNQQAPEELNYDFWLGPAPKRPYNPLRSHGTFRHFWDYSGGTFIDFWCHIADVAFWAMNLDAPSIVSSTGGRYYINDGTETTDTQHASFEFPELIMTYDLHPQPQPGYAHMGGIGAVFVGEEATLVTNYSDHELYVDGERVSDFPEPEMHIPNSPGHLREFLNAVKNRNMDTTCNVEYGHNLSKVGLLANIAYRTESTLHWDDSEEEIIGNPAASQLLSRSFRHPWTLELS